jgi:ribose transport system permease protein
LTTANPSTKLTPRIKRKITGLSVFFIALCIIYIVINIVTAGKFLSAFNIKTIITHAVFGSILAFGMSFIFSAGIIDLSIGSKVLLSSNVGLVFAYDLKLGYPGLLLGTILCCIVLQLISSWLVVSLKIPSWIAGLGLALVLEAVLAEYSTARIKAGLTSVINVTDDMRAFGVMPLMFIIMMICFVAAFILFNYTKIGIYLRAIGSNVSVAEAMGVNYKKTIFIGAIVGAIFIGIASVIQVSYTTKLEAVTGLSSLARIFNSLAAVLLAASISRIFNNIVGILISSVVLMSVFNALTMLGIPSGTWQTVVLGAIIVICGILANFGNKGVVK